MAALKDAEKRLDNDSILSNSIAMSKKIVLPLFFNLGNPIDKASTSGPDYIKNNSLPPGFFVNSITDRDGMVRSEPLFINFKDRLSPSFALQLTLK